MQEDLDLAYPMQSQTLCLSIQPAATCLMEHSKRVEIQRTVTILLPHDADLRATLTAFCSV
jgi:hypothetical protein